MEKFDLVVVGTSFAATFFLKKYLEKSSTSSKVLVLERGTLYSHKQRIRELRGENVVNKPPIINGDNAIINNNEEKEWVFQAAFGGNSNCWVGCTPRFMPSDFKLKTLYGVGADWPISYEDLEPYYYEAEELMHISGPDETPFPKKTSYPQPPHIFSTVDEILHKTYGNLYIHQPTARSRVSGKGRNACCVSNQCYVCPMNAKFTIENSGFGVYEDKRVSVVYEAQVLALHLEGDVVKNVVYLKDGREEKASGEVIALGANAIFNAHILLNSGDNSSNTGKGIGEQLGLGVIVKLKNFDNVGGSTHVTANGYMLYDGSHRKEAAACLMESSTKPFIRLERGKYRHMAVFRMVFEDLPLDSNYLALSSDKSMPEIHYTGFSEYTKKGIERMKKELPQLLACLPVEEIIFEKRPYKTESHIIGTTRMSANPSDGVVDKHLIHHKYRNLFLLGSGSFSTYSPSNPTLTLSALSLFSADKSF